MTFKKFKRSVPISGYTTFRAGGPAAFLAEVVTTDELIEAARTATEMGQSWKVIGHGSNILASDGGVNSAIIVFKSEVSPRASGKDEVEVQAGYPLSKFIDFLTDSGLSALENLAGIPGTVGGAVAGNAGAYGVWTGNAVLRARILRGDGQITILENQDLAFDYRTSAIKNSNCAILDVTFKTKPGDSFSLKKIAADKMADRKLKHPNPLEISTAGSFFMNPLDESGKRIAAGLLLEKAGCKGLKVGTARIWDTHANIIVSDGDCRSKDVQALSCEMAKRVEAMFGVKLVPEVTFLE